MTSRRLPEGGTWVDRSKPIAFRFDGVRYEGFEGDTLASALLANGVVGGFRSPILGRPRGIFSAGIEEPNALVAVREPWVDLIVPATVVPLGRRAGRRRPGPAWPTSPTAATHRRRPGIASPRRDARGGGQAVPAEPPPPGRPAAVTACCWSMNGTCSTIRRPDRTMTTLCRTPRRSASTTTATSSCTNALEPWTTIWHVRAANVVLATGALERPIAFAGNDLPGVMLAGAVVAYVERYGVAPGDRAVVFATNDRGLAAAEILRGAGVEVARTVDARDGEAVTEARGDAGVEEVAVRNADGTIEVVDADLLVISGGWNPNLTLWRSIGGGLRYRDASACFVPDGGPSWLSVTGAAAGDLPASVSVPFVEEGDDASKFVDLQRDQTVADIAATLESGLRSVEHVKRATYIGTAVDQGRTSGVLAAEIVNAMLGEGPGAQGPSNARPPSAPVPFAALAGPYGGDLLDPIRTTPIHPWHVERAAVFEDVGQWKRPWYFPLDGESMEQAVERECLAVRNAVGAMDASTLGKIEVVGTDAPAFLDRMYTNRMSNLAVGGIRYGLMLGLDGMVLDDGVAMRLAEDRYLVTTTTGGAATVLDRFEEWLQTEWPELRVWCTSVTEQWAVIAVNGPRARDVVSATGTDVDLSREAFPFMTFRDGSVAGVPARLARVSFSGELAYELHVAGGHGLEVWEAVMAAGEPFGIEPYGTEAMHVLRAEKGYVIVGQDTDGSVTPADLGMDWIVNPSKGDFVGRRSLRRSDTARPDRKHLVGLLPVTTDAQLPEGAQIVLEDTGRIPMPLAGHVTSSYRSPALERSFALAMVAGGHELHGRTVYAPLPEGTIACTVTSPTLYDPEGARRDG